MIGDPVQDLINNKDFIKCLSKRALALMVEFIFNIVKGELLKLIIPVSKLILKEKINQYIGLIRSLTKFI